MVGVISEFDLIAKPDSRTAGEAMTRDVVSVGTTIINRSSHIPIRTHTAAIVAVVMVRSRRIPSSTNGITK